ncbi:MAG: Imm26 family immunity protein [Proteobacteria bacterium]|nr:Imm26 family immunity protein [Pseudomonadota bacterium]
MAIELREGQFFLLPLERSQYAVGLVARAPRRGGVLLGYFFGPRRIAEPSRDWLNSRLPLHAVFVCRFKDTSLFRSEWRQLDALSAFKRADWPVPAFHRFEGSVTYIPGGSSVTDWRVEYNDDNMVMPVSEAPAQGADLRLTDDLVYDARLLATEVGERIAGSAPSADDDAWR